MATRPGFANKARACNDADCAVVVVEALVDWECFQLHTGGTGVVVVKSSLLLAFSSLKTEVLSDDIVSPA
jgi:hypothetical protein